jgi:hypothetical protein
LAGVEWWGERKKGTSELNFDFKIDFYTLTLQVPRPKTPGEEMTLT